MVITRKIPRGGEIIPIKNTKKLIAKQIAIILCFVSQ